MATGIHGVDGVQWSGLAAGKWSLQRAFLKAQLALGERMFKAGLDDGQTSAHLAALDRELRRSSGETATRLLAERKQLLLQLAAAALEDDAPLPGADAEYRQARETQAAFQAHLSRKAFLTPSRLAGS
jgi:hypothetical protein